MNEGLLEPGQSFPGADIDPAAIMSYSAHATLLHGIAQQGRKREFARLAAGKQGLPIDSDTTESQPFAS